jgi:acyl-[acyl-carrier-protein]-phospholipid O-acyltransferase/long-chain-fatty-acid--[acyl-carrier-protein] ligase
MQNTSHLLKSKRFLPLFIAQFFGAFNDNVFKNALVIFITYKIGQESGVNPQILVTLVAFLFILPFFLFSALAGQIADKFDKAQIAKIIKFIEIFLMSFAIVGFYTKNLPLLMSVLFAMGMHSAFFGPVKYGILPQLLKKDEIIAGNGLISSATFISILLGTIIGGLLILQESGVLILAFIMILASLLGFSSSFFIPKTGSQDNFKISFNIFSQSLKIIAQAKQNRRIFLSIIGISWFWFIGATFLAQFPNFTKNILFGNNEIVTLLLTVFSIGIALGSLICNRLLKGEVSAIYAPISLILISIFTIDLYFSSLSLVHFDENLVDFAAFVKSGANLRILADFFLIAIASGVYIVPLYAIIQSESEDENRARIIAALNIFDSGFMVCSAIFTVILLKLNFTIAQIFLAIAFVNFIVVVYVCKLLPDALPKSILRAIFKALYKVEIKGLENYRNASGNVVIVANHTSFLDAALIATFLPDKFSFAVDTQIATRWYFKPFFKMADIFPIDPTNPMAVKSMINLVKQGKRLMIFPEGRITMTGTLMKVYSGPAVIAQKADAMIIPIRIDGAQYSPFSRLKGRVRIKLFPKITLTVMPAQKLSAPDDVGASEKRNILANKLYDLMTELVFETSNYKKTLFSSLIDAAKINGFSHKIIEDFTFKSLNYRGLIAKSFGLGLVFEKISKPKEFVGVLLPNSNVTAVTFFALHAFSRIPTMLNFSSGVSNLLASAKTADLKTIITSRNFIEKAKMEDVILEFEKQGQKIVYLEDLAQKTGFFTKIYAFFTSFTPESFYKIKNKKYQDANLPCVVLFTSGSEGSPKGVVLSHKNIQANRCQLSSKIDFGPKDIVFNALPMFHSFGLTGGTLLPILSGVKTFFYPSPLHYKIVPELIYSTNATILFGTNTFLNGYARFAHNYDFYSLRYVFAGAEKVFDETRKIWAEKFGVRILEGYGATETSPIISVNTAMQNKAGSVGKAVPSINIKLEEVAGIDDGKRLIVQGSNVMLGYLLADNPGVLQATKNNEYDTGDIVFVDDEGYIFIKGRAKRFAKIAGEMVSLTAVEANLSKLWPNNACAVVALPDDKKGEQIILLTEKKDAQRSDISTFFKENGLSELAVPKSIIYVDKVPLLGTGKVDYVEVRAIAVKNCI